jgi:hypothetical protein
MWGVAATALPPEVTTGLETSHMRINSWEWTFALERRPQNLSF